MWKSHHLILCSQLADALHFSLSSSCSSLARPPLLRRPAPLASPSSLAGDLTSPWVCSAGAHSRVASCGFLPPSTPPLPFFPPPVSATITLRYRGPSLDTVTIVLSLLCHVWTFILPHVALLFFITIPSNVSLILPISCLAPAPAPPDHGRMSTGVYVIVAD